MKSSLKRYSVWLSSRTRLALQKPLRTQGLDSIVEAASLHEAVGPFGPGLIFRVETDAPSIEHAMNSGELAAAQLADALAFVHATDISDPEPLIAVSEGDSTGTREFAQFIRNLPMTTVQLRFLKEQPFQDFYAKLTALPNGPLRDRIIRAVRLLRRALSDPDPIDAFEDTWGALETVNHLLKAKYNLPTTYPGKPCKRCGEPSQILGSSAGIKYVLDLADLSVWKQANQLRKEIAHAIETHDSIVRRIPGVLPQLQRAVTMAVLKLLDMSDADFIRIPLNPKVPAQAFVSAVLSGWQGPPSIKVDNLPFLDVAVRELSRIGDFGSPGTKTVTHEVGFTPRNLTGTMSAFHAKFRVSKDPEDKGSKMQVSDFRIQTNRPA